jgi:hypothetical protein
MEKQIKIGDTVYTDTHAVYQKTQESLSRLKGTVISNRNNLYQVKIIGKPNWGIIEFSTFELSLEKKTVYVNEQ